MRRARYVFSHAVTPLIVFILLTAVLTNGIWFVLSQRRSMENGLEVILIDTALSLGQNEQLAQSLRERTGVKYTGVSTLSSEETAQYVSTVEGYTMATHVQTLAHSRDAELLFVPGPLLKELISIAEPLGMDIAADEKCFADGVLYAMPVSGLSVTGYGASLSATSHAVYALLLPGDHINEARGFLKTLTE